MSCYCRYITYLRSVLAGGLERFVVNGVNRAQVGRGGDTWIGSVFTPIAKFKTRIYAKCEWWGLGFRVQGFVFRV